MFVLLALAAALPLDLSPAGAARGRALAGARPYAGLARGTDEHAEPAAFAFDRVPPTAAPAKPAAPAPRGAATGPGRAAAPNPNKPNTGSGADPNDPRSQADADAAAAAVSWERWWEVNSAHYLRAAQLALSDVESSAARDDSAPVSDVLRPSLIQIENVIAPALRTALAEERSGEVAGAALIALAELGDTPDEGGASALARTCTARLADPRAGVRESALLALGVLAEDSSVATLAHVLRDDVIGRAAVAATSVPDHTRAFAALALGRTGAHTQRDGMRRSIVPVFCEVLALDPPAATDVQIACVLALGRAPLPFTATEAQREQRSASREGVLRELAHITADVHRDALVRAHAPRALAQLVRASPERWEGPERAEAVNALIGALDDAPATVRQGIVLALGRLGDADLDAVDVRVREELQGRADHDGDAATKNFACVALGECGGRTGSGLGAAIGARRVREFLAAELTLSAGPQRAWAALGIGVLEHACAANAESVLRPSNEQRALLRAQLAAARTPDELGALAIACGLARDPDAGTVLAAKLATTTDDAARGHLATALGLLGARAALPEVLELVRAARARPLALERAVLGLGLLARGEQTRELCALLETGPDHSAQSSAVLRAAARALALLGDARAAATLAATLANTRGPNVVQRACAAAVLGRIASAGGGAWEAEFARDIDYLASTAVLSTETRTGVLDRL